MTTEANHTIEMRLDGWADEMKGFSGLRTSQYIRNRASIQDLGALYDTDWLARKIVDLPVDFAFKGGLNFSDEKLLKAFDEANSSFYSERGHLAHGLSMGRLHAGAVLIVLPDMASRGGDAALPWSAGDGYRHIIVERYRDLGIEYDRDPESRTVNTPLYYKLSTSPFQGMRVHSSRCIVCPGLPKANPTLDKPWVSVLDPVFEAIANYGFSWTAVSNLIKESSIMWLRMQGLVEGIGKAGTNQEDATKGRLRFMSKTKSNNNILFLDTDEECGRLEASFADLPAVMQEMSLVVCGAANLPATLLFGRSPAGMNATGESDMQHFRSSVGEYRSGSVSKKVSRFVELTTGIVPQVITFGDLDSPTVLEQEERRKKRFEGDETLWRMEGLDALQIIYARIKNNTLGLELPEELVSRIEAEIKKPKAQNTLTVSVTDAPYFTYVDEARAANNLPPDPVNGKKLLAEVKAELDNAGADLSQDLNTPPKDPLEHPEDPPKDSPLPAKKTGAPKETKDPKKDLDENTSKV